MSVTVSKPKATKHTNTHGNCRHCCSTVAVMNGEYQDHETPAACVREAERSLRKVFDQRLQDAHTRHSFQLEAEAKRHQDQVEKLREQLAATEKKVAETHPLSDSELQSLSCIAMLPPYFAGSEEARRRVTLELRRRGLISSAVGRGL